MVGVLVCALALVVIGLFRPASAAAAEATLTFEDHALGTQITTQHHDTGGAGQGVVLGSGPTGPSGARAFVRTRTGAASGTNVVPLFDGSGEFGIFGMWGSFPSGGKRLVRVAVGAPSGHVTRAIALRAYDTTGTNLIATDTKDVPGSGTHATVLSIQDPSARIAFFTITLSGQALPSFVAASGVEFTMDDLAFDVPDPGSPPPPPPAPDFGLILGSGALSPPLQTRVGTTSAIGASVLVGRFGGSSGALDTQVTGLPPGVSAIVTPDVASSPGAFSVRLTASAAAAAPKFGTATLTATPGPTSGSAPRSVVLPYGIYEDFDVAVTGVEVNQGIQDGGALPPRAASPSAWVTYSGVPLVRDKTTVVRVFGRAAPGGAKISGVGVLLHGRTLKGAALPGSPLAGGFAKPLTSGPDEVGPAPRASATTTTARFTLPIEWTRKGKIELEAEVLPPKLIGGPAECAAASCANNNHYRLRGVPFSDTGYLNVAGIHFASDDRPFPGFPDEMLAGIAQLMPLREDGIRRTDYWQQEHDVTWLVTAPNNAAVFPSVCKPNDPFYFGAAFCSAPPVLDKPLLGTVVGFESGESGCDNRPFHLRHPYCFDAVMGFLDGRIAGLSKGGRDVLLTGARAVANLRRPLTSTGHELLHGFGLEHASAGCGGNADGQKGDTSWPDPFGTIGSAIGYDVRTGSVIADGTAPARTADAAAAADPGTWYDPMSYCADFGGEEGLTGQPFPLKTADTWISPRNWRYLHGRLIVLNSLRKGASANAAASHGSQSPVLEVRGFIEQGRVLVTGARIVRERPLQDPASPYVLFLRDAQGGALAEAGLVVESTEGHGGAAELISARVPVPGGGSTLPAAVAALEVRSASGAVGGITRSANRPRVRIIGPRRGSRVGRGALTAVRWVASDADGDALSAWIDYSADGGRTWTTVWAGTNRRRVAISSRLLSASRRARLRVRVSDGLDEATSTSPRFIAVGRPPTVTILRPARKTRLRAGERLTLLAAANDDRRRTLSGRAVLWFDGRRRIGAGAATGARVTRTGTRRIRVVARDRLGRTATATVRVRVLRASPRLILRSAPRRLARGRRALTLRLAATLPTRVVIRGRAVRRRVMTARLGTRARRVVVPITRGRATVRLVLRAPGGPRLAVVIPRR